MRAGNQGLVEGRQSWKGVLQRLAGHEIVSVGVNIKLPFEQKINNLVDDAFECGFFCIRKTLLLMLSEGPFFIFAPGGFGTLEELFETLMMMSLGRIPKRTCYLVGSSYWKGFIEAVSGTIPNDILSLIVVTDDPHDVRYDVDSL